MSDNDNDAVWTERLTPAQELAIDSLISKLNEALHGGKVGRN